jgi:hypothetical protein
MALANDFEIVRTVSPSLGKGYEPVIQLQLKTALAAATREWIQIGAAISIPLEHIAPGLMRNISGLRAGHGTGLPLRF